MASSWTIIPALDGGADFDWTAPRAGFEFSSAMGIMLDVLNDRGLKVNRSFNITPSYPNYMQWDQLCTNTRQLMSEFLDVSALPSDPSSVNSYTEVLTYQGEYIFKTSENINYSVEDFWVNLETITGEDLSNWRKQGADAWPTQGGQVVVSDLLRQFYVLMSITKYCFYVGGGSVLSGMVKDGDVTLKPNDIAYAETKAEHDADMTVPVSRLRTGASINRRVFWLSGAEAAAYSMDSEYVTMQTTNLLLEGATLYNMYIMVLPTRASLNGFIFNDFGMGFSFEDILHDPISEVAGIITYDLDIAQGVDFTGYELKPNSSGPGDVRRSDIGFQIGTQYIIANIDIIDVISYYTP